MADYPKGSSAYVRTRDEIIEDFFIRDGFDPREIATRMLADGTLKCDSLDPATRLESAMRTVRGVVAKIRARINTARIGDSERSLASNESDALERKLVWLRAQRDHQQLIADGEPIEMCARSSYPIGACPNKDCADIGSHVSHVGPKVGITFMQTPQGPMTTFKALWPAGVRQKASKDAATLAGKIADLELLLISRREDQAGSFEDGGGDRLHLIESDKSIHELIEANLLVGTFGKKKNDGSGGAATTG